MASNLRLLAAIAEDDELLLLSSMKEKETVCVAKLNIEELTNEQCRTLF